MPHIDRHGQRRRLPRDIKFNMSRTLRVRWIDQNLRKDRFLFMLCARAHIVAMPFEVVRVRQGLDKIWRIARGGQDDGTEQVL